MKQPTSFTVLAMYLDENLAHPECVTIATLTPPRKGKFRNWAPCEGDVIPPEVVSDSTYVLEKVLVVPTKQELAFLEAMQSLDKAGSGILVTFEILCSKCRERK